MKNLTLKQFRYFEALARHGHFGRAAADCAITQPALSVQVRELEALIGAPLVERGGRQTRLTGLGEAFAARAREILREPRVVVAIICGMVSYALMNLVMTSTPLAVVGCGYDKADAADIVSGHVLAMFIPSFFTGHLIARFGVGAP